MTTNRLQTIATRQSKSLARDLLFSVLVALAVVVSITSVGTAAQAANNSAAQSQIAHR